MDLQLFPFTSEEKAKFRDLDIEQCQALKQWLDERIKFLQSVPRDQTPLEKLNLSNRAHHALVANRLFTVKDVLLYGINRLGLLRYVGTKSEKEIKTVIHEFLNDNQVAD